MQDYFNYRMFCVMNITDVDDKVDWNVSPPRLVAATAHQRYFWLCCVHMSFYTLAEIRLLLSVLEKTTTHLQL